MVNRTSEEALSNYKERMGDELGEIFHHLLQDTYYVSSIWDQYETLFGRKERIDLLNSSGGFFFGNVQRIFFDYTLLAICRLTDPEKSLRRENLTIRRLIQLVRPNIKTRAAELIDAAVAKSTFCRDWRNRKIAHNDLEHKLDASPRLEAATRRGVTASLIAIQDVLRLLAGEYCDTDLGFVQIGDDAAIHLLHQLFFGKRWTDARLDKLRQKRWDATDFDTPEWLTTQNPLSRYSSR